MVRLGICVVILLLAPAQALAQQTPPPPPVLVQPTLPPGILSRPRVESNVRVPDYPLESIKAREEGDVTLELCVSKDGKGSGAKVVRSSGFPRLDEAAVAWTNGPVQFTPARTASGPVRMCGYLLTYAWKLPKDGEFPFGPPAPVDPMAILAPFPDISDLKNVIPPRLIAKDAPVYPGKDLPPGDDSLVSATVCVQFDGHILSIVKMTEIEPLLAQMSALSWLMAARFEPAKRNGEAVSVCGVEVHFNWRMAE